MLKLNLSLLATGLLMATGANAQNAEVTVQDAMVAIRDHAVEICGAELAAVNDIMAETDRVSVLESAVATAKDRGAWGEEWPIATETLKASAFVEVAKNHALEQALLLSFVGHYADSTDAGDLEATRYQAAAVAAKAALASCLMPSAADLQGAADRVQPDVASVLETVSCKDLFATSQALTEVALNAESSAWSDAAAVAEASAAKTCLKGS